MPSGKWTSFPKYHSPVSVLSLYNIAYIVTAKPLPVAIDVSHVAAPGLPVTIIVCEPDAVPSDVNKSLRAWVDKLQPDIEKPTVIPCNNNLIKLLQFPNAIVVELMLPQLNISTSLTL